MSKHEELTRQVKQLARKSEDANRQAAGLKQSLNRNIRQVQAVLGRGGSGPIGQLSYALDQANQDIDRLSVNLHNTKKAAEEFARHLESLN
ncbi:hypothetical protein [Gordonia sihwensis]|uniref:hypothetical protein n=1 Tax=Gordonia sihwensis TaxID=173559 RepID=UPI0005F013FE|nr:hypothetical protein [Gordonia sihwensis]KJR05589.1 hypothetical protein UG54_16015 [Gordonia sihwensis]MBY4568430.1 hypothetical protein [Gordonia sihwensis]